ncbi:hypothetical protein D3C85_1917590 [compost metagenome]
MGLGRYIAVTVVRDLVVLLALLIPDESERRPDIALGQIAEYLADNWSAPGFFNA